MRISLFLVLVFVAPRVAHADDAACVKAHRQAQLDRKAGKLKAAEGELRVCSEANCPEMITSDCNEWRLELERSMPSVVIAVTDPDGHDARDVKVFVDDSLLTERLDGSAIRLDPGEHRFRFEMAGAVPIARTVLLREGEQARAVNVAFPRTTGKTARKPESPAKSEGTGPVPWVLGAAGIVALGASGWFYYQGLTKKRDLDDADCKPSCERSQVDAGKRSILVADVLLGVGVLALGTATFLVVTSPREPSVALRGRF
jgi:hypothetical protein